MYKFRLIASLLLLLSAIAGAAEVRLVPGEIPLQQQLATAPTGATVLLAAGTYEGPLHIEHSINLIGEDGAIIDGAGQGNVITINAPDVTVRGLTVINSGISLATEDSGIFVTQEAARAVVEGNTLQNNLIGVYLKGPNAAVVRGNLIEGRRDLRRNERGNGVHLWNTPGSVVEHNTIRYGRDGIFVTTSRNNRFHANRFEQLRYAIHYMYTHDSEISANYSSGNQSGYALMFSDRLIVNDNISIGDHEHGIFLNFANYSEIKGNVVRGSMSDSSLSAAGSQDSEIPVAKDCVFIYNANLNRLRDNHFEGCAVGVHFTAGSERNQITGNAFIDNREQVKYVGTRVIEWSVAGRGNYWSDNTSFDLNGDGIADQPYRPNDLTDQLLWRYPQTKLLLNSPALQLLSWMQSQFPGLHPGGVVDSAPLLQEPQQGLQHESQRMN